MSAPQRKRWQRRFGSLGVRIRAKLGDHLRWIEAHKDYTGDDCLFWPYCRHAHGYGKTAVNGSTVYVHQVMCKHRNGPAPVDKPEAAHSCGNGHAGCVNPQHLRWASRRENVADAIAHGTIAKGERNAHAKLTAADVLVVRSSPDSRLELSRRFNVSKTTIDCIIWRKSWNWLLP